MEQDMWRSIPCTISELRLDTTLACGQSFRWKETCSGIWTGVMHRKVWKFKQNDYNLLYQVIGKKSSGERSQAESQADKAEIPVKIDIPEFDSSCILLSDSQHRATSLKVCDCHKESMKCACSYTKFDYIVRDYFQLDVNLSKLYKQWEKADENFKKTASTFQGIRMLRQDPVENLFSFICSSNNNISRISSMVEKMCERFGSKITEVDGKSYYSFPTVESLSEDGVEEALRSLGFGYRAKFINKTAIYIKQHPDNQWLNNLRTLPYQEAKQELLKLCGVGAKVADCVCLMSLDKTEAVPVDTHVWQIAARDYMPKLKQSKSLTDSLYKEIGDCFRNIWGDYAGWAHSVLFTADLKQFKDKNTVKNKADKEKRKRKSDTSIKKEVPKKKS